MFETLEALCKGLNLIPGLATCKIGYEAQITPSDYPIARIVPVRIAPGKPYYNRTADTDIFFGVNITESEGLYNVYQDLFILEEAILKVLKAQNIRYIETLTDQDRLATTYKLMSIRCEVQAELLP